MPGESGGLAWLLKAYWEVIAGLAVAAVTGIRLWFRRHQKIDERFVAIESRMPPLSEGKMLCSRKHVDDCQDKVRDEAANTHREVMEEMKAIHARLDRIMELLVQRGAQ